MSKKKYQHHDTKTGALWSERPEYDSVFDSKKTSNGNKSTYQWAAVTKCYESHPALKLGQGMFYGGSCSNPTCKIADVYIGFDYGMKLRPFKPWKGDSQPLDIAYEINDRQPPKDAEDFKQLIAWAAQQLEQGKIVHAGCIGGHGRTGTFLAALYSVMHPEELDVISTVRKLYCKKAVESESQVKFLVDHFGVKSVSGADHQWSSQGSVTSVPIKAAPGKFGVSGLPGVTPASGQPTGSSMSSRPWPSSTGGKEFKKSPSSALQAPKWEPVKSSSSFIGSVI